MQLYSKFSTEINIYFYKGADHSVYHHKINVESRFFFSELVENRWWDSSRPHNQNVSFPHADRLKAMDCTLQSQVFSSTNTQIFLIHARTSNVHIRFKPVFSISSTSRNFFASELVWALRSRLWVWKQPCSYLKTGRTCNIRPSVSIGPRAALANFD